MIKKNFSGSESVSKVSSEITIKPTSVTSLKPIAPAPAISKPFVKEAPKAAKKPTVQKTPAEKAVSKKTPGKTAKLPLAGSYYQIISKQSGKAVETSDTDAVYMNAPSKEAAQQFRFIPSGKGCCFIENKATGKVLDVILAGTENGAHIHQWDCTGADNQLWKLEEEGGAYIIKSKASDKCMDIVEMSVYDGARIQIWEDVHGENQQWLLKPIAKKAPAKKSSKMKKASSKKKTSQK